MRSASTSIPRSRNASVSLLDQTKGITVIRDANKFRSRIRAAVVHDDDFENGCVDLLAQGLQTLTEQTPIIVDSYDNAEFGSHR